MACDCDELGNRLRNAEDRIRRLERGGSGASGGANNPQDIESIIRKAVERVYKDNRWLQAVGILGMLSTGKAGITSLGNLQSPASGVWQRGIESLNRSYQAQSAASAAKGKAADALSKSIDAQLKSKTLSKAVEQTKTVAKIAKDEATLAKNAANGVQRTAEQAKKAADASKALSELNKKNIVKEVQKVEKEIVTKTKPLQDAYKKIDKGVQRLSKGLDKFTAAAGLGFGIAGVIISFAALWTSERNQAAFDRQIDAFQADMSKQGSFNQLIQNRFKKLRADFDAYQKKSEKTFDYQSQDLKQARSIADKARKLANDTLYEARVKIQKLNDITAQANSNASKALVQQTAIKQQITTVDTKATKAATEASTARAGVKLVDSKATLAQKDATQARIGVKLVDTKATTALTTAQQIPAKIPSLVAPQIAPVKAENIKQDAEIAALKNNVKALQNAPKTNTPTTNQPGTNTPTINQAQVNQAVNNSITGMGIIPRLGAVETTAQTALARSTAALSRAEQEPIGNRALGLGAGNAGAIAKLDQDIKQLKAPNILEPRIDKLETKVKEREKVDAAANQKLDQLVADRSKLEQLLILTGGLGLMAPQIINTLSPKIDGIPDKAANAVAAAPCNGKGCGGKTAARVDGISDELGALRQQVNSLPNTVGNVVNGANALANTAQLGLLNTINSKLGNALPNGGIGGILSRMAKSSAADKAMQFATLMMTLHNGFFLSRDLTQSFFSLSSSALNATMRTFGITTADDTPIDVGQIINTQLQEALKALIGAENLAQLNQALASFNRIYQAGANVISNVWSMHDSTQNVLEYTASNTGKIGNALKRDRVVAQDAFPDMSERVNARSSRQKKLDDIVEGISDLSTGVSALDSVFQEVVNINDTVVEYKRSTEELSKSIKDSPIPTVAENLAVKAKRQAESVASKSPESISEVAREPAEV